MKRILAILVTVAMLMATLAVVIGAEEVVTDTMETEAVETEAVETEVVETETVETETVETEVVETETVETEVVETEPAETEPMEKTTSAQAAAPVEPSTTAKEPPSTEPETQASLIPSDVANALIHATPEQLEAVKQYLEKGINVLEEKTGWDRVTDFLLEHVEELAWIVCAIAFVACMCVVMTAKKKFGLSATTMNNNAVEIAEKSERLVESMKNEAINACREMKEQAHEAAEKASDAFERFSAADEKNASAVSCLAVVVEELLQVSNLPQWKRDEFRMKFDEAMSHVSGHENGVSGDDAEG